MWFLKSGSMKVMLECISGDHLSGYGAIFNGETGFFFNLHLANSINMNSYYHSGF